MTNNPAITSDQIRFHLQRLKELLQSHGIREALKYMNHQANLRFSAIYYFGVNDTLHNLYLYDRENPESDTMPDIPIEASYCAFVRSSSAPFLVSDSLQDKRVATHPKRPVIQCYTGVPLVEPGGKMVGTICHFDFKPGHVDILTVELMEAMGPLLLQHHQQQENRSATR